MFRAAKFWTSFSQKIHKIAPASTSTDSQNNISWVRPPAGWYKLNIDGSSKKGYIAAGGLIRSDTGEWTIGFSKFLGSGSVILAECWSLLLGRQIVVQLEIKNIEVETDCQHIVNLAQVEVNDFHPLAILLFNCRNLLLYFEDYKLIKIHKK